jgi:hypothetical protein
MFQVRDSLIEWVRAVLPAGRPILELGSGASQAVGGPAPRPLTVDPRRPPGRGPGARPGPRPGAIGRADG